MSTPLQTTPADLSGQGITLDIGKQRLLDDVDIAVAAGQRIAIIGPNGSGKSTLLRCLHAWLLPQNGTILLDGRALSAMPARERAKSISVMTQEAEAGLGMTVCDVVALGRIADRGGWLDDAPDPDCYIDRVMGLANIGTLAERSFSSLSGGERQRVMFARALAQNPRLLLLDEPTNHLDIGHQFDLMDIARRCGASVIATLHDLNLAARWADRVYLMNKGRIASCGAVADVLEPALIGQIYDVDVERDTDPRTGTIRLSFYPRTQDTAA